MKYLKNCDLAIEAVTEYEDTKKRSFGDLYVNFIPKDAYIGTNTSSISITRLRGLYR